PRLMSVNRNLYSNDLLIRSGQNIYLNGVHLTANADSFEIIRWIPHSLLVFRDNKGLHRYPFGQLSGKAIPVDDDVSFEVGESRVRWRKQLTPDRQWSKWIDLPGIEPQQFHLITGNIAQYKDRLYVTKLSTFGEDQLEIIPLDTPDLVIDRSFNSGKQHAYFIRQLRSKSLQIIPVNGPLTKNDRFAYDDRNVYIWTDTEVRITPSPCPAKTRVREENVREVQNRDIIILVTDESCRNAADGQTLKP
ncbi:DKNYY family protein, partial [Escherichia coli]|nr:DKNYY family protein [Escherichia coli]